VTVAWPGITAVARIYVIAACAIITGALEIAEPIQLRRYITHECLLVLGGIAPLVLGVLLLIAPLAGVLIAI